MEVKSKTFIGYETLNPRDKACKFASEQGADLVSITESHYHDYLHVTVYYWDRS